MNYRSPNLEIVGIVNLEHRVIVVGGAQFDIALIPVCQVKASDKGF